MNKNVEFPKIPSPLQNQERQISLVAPARSVSISKMKTWSLMYGLVWAAFFQILIILFPVFGVNIAVGLHVVVGIIVLSLAYYSFARVRATACPDRIKRITKTTAYLGIAQGVLGILLYASIQFKAGSIIQGVITFVHVATALAIITQASSSATAYDMWEEKEFIQGSNPIPAP